MVSYEFSPSTSLSHDKRSRDIEFSSEMTDSSSQLIGESFEPLFLVINIDDEVPMGKGCRENFSSTRLNGHITNITYCASDSDFVDSSWYQIDDYVDCYQFSESHCAFLATITVGVILRSYD